MASEANAPLAVAAGPGGRWATGNARGVRLSVPGRPERRLATRGAVRALAFASDGALWIGTDTGLLRYAGAGLVDRSPRAGRPAELVTRLAIAPRDPDVLAVATAAGVFWSLDGRAWLRVSGAFGELPATGLAFTDAGRTLWIAAERGLFMAPLPERAEAARATRAPLPELLLPALDVWASGNRVFAVGRGRLAAGPERWSIHRPTLPPGALPIRLFEAYGRLWLGTDRGLLSASGAAGPWRRAPEPAGAASVRDVAVGRDGLRVAARSGLLSGGPAAEHGAVQAPLCEPPVAAVQRAALRYTELDRRAVSRMRRGVRRRGFWPQVDLRAAYARDDDHGRDYDQTFVSGSTRHLWDRDRGRRRERAIAVELHWDLGDIWYHPEEIDVSTEARRVVELRDDVLDEINQLYFDRLRALGDAEQAPPGSSEGAAARLRADELAAGLDAWTGGWFGAERDACATAR
ncbi:MAG: hypothetical protein QNK03_10365 [Myxococcota bacterium]|nr:hypothetical protein [Myxococcota bacterium]